MPTKSKFFKNKGPFSLQTILSYVKGRVYLNCKEVSLSEAKNIMIDNVSTLRGATTNDLTFLSNTKYRDEVLSTKATACLLDTKVFEKVNNEVSNNLYLIVVENAHVAFAHIASVFYPEGIVEKTEISKFAHISDSAVLGTNCQVMCGSYIGNDVKLGNNVVIHPNVYIGDNVIIDDGAVIYDSVSVKYCTIGKRVIIHPGAKIGQDGFSYASDNGKHIKIPQFGIVVIGNDVEIGANTTIDRGAIEDTIIGDMTKIDNLVQIGHNVVVGKGCIIVAQTGIAGSSKLGNYVVLGGQVGIAGHLNIGDQVQAGAQSGIIRDIPPQEVVFGSPALPLKEKMREVAMLKKMVKRDKHGK